MPYYVTGKGAEYFEGLTDNTQISLAIRQANTELDEQWKIDNGMGETKPNEEPSVVIWIVVGVAACVVIVGGVVSVIIVKKKRGAKG